LAADGDVLHDIHEKIVIKLYRDGALAQCAKTAGIQSWLYKLSKNRALDWAKARYRKKRLPTQDSEGNTGPLDSPLGPDAGFTFHDVPESAGSPEADRRLERLRVFIENVLDEIVGIPNQKILWTVRLSMLSILPLSDEELSSLAKFSGIPRGEVASRIEGISEELERKVGESDADLGRAVILWHEMRRLERRINEDGRNPLAYPANAAPLQAELQAMRKRRGPYLESAFRFHRPSNADIAPLVGLPEEKAEQVSTLLLRGRKILQDRFGEDLIALVSGGRDG
jgi:hypothetical protein